MVTSFQRVTGAGNGLRRTPQDRPGTPALAGLAVAALRPGTDTARAGRWALVRCKNHRKSPAAPGTPRPGRIDCAQRSGMAAVPAPLLHHGSRPVRPGEALPR